jgi:hypothetical protein
MYKLLHFTKEKQYPDLDAVRFRSRIRILPPASLFFEPLTAFLASVSHFKKFGLTLKVFFPILFLIFFFLSSFPSKIGFFFVKFGFFLFLYLVVVL